MTSRKARRRQERNRKTGLMLTSVGVVVALAGYVALDVADIAPGFLTTKPPVEVQALPQPAPESHSSVDMPALADDAPVPRGLKQRLDPIFDSAKDPSKYSAEVRDATTGDTLYGKDANRARTPASVTKVLTATAALDALGPSSRFTTETLLDGDTLFLKGGGDVLLGSGKSDPNSIIGHAGLGTLAETTSAFLKDRGRTSVTLRADVSRYKGADFRKKWDPADIGMGNIAPVKPLMVDAGLVSRARFSAREHDPVGRAVKDFAKALKKRGIDVKIEKPHAAPKSAEKAAQVESAPVSSVIRYMLLHSENVVAEILGIEVAIKRGDKAGLGASPQAVLNQLKDMDLDTASITLGDTSGLIYDNRISPHELTQIITSVVQREELAELLPSMPVGGLSGTLIERYTDPETKPAAGVVSAKTGSLATVTSLSGVVTTKDGRLLTFTIMADDLEPGGSGEARQVADRAVSALAECGCTG